jgi:hypothetical protein
VAPPSASRALKTEPIVRRPSTSWAGCSVSSVVQDDNRVRFQINPVRDLIQSRHELTRQIGTDEDIA